MTVLLRAYKNYLKPWLPYLSSRIWWLLGLVGPVLDFFDITDHAALFFSSAYLPYCGLVESFIARLF